MTFDQIMAKVNLNRGIIFYQDEGKKTKTGHQVIEAVSVTSLKKAVDSLNNDKKSLKKRLMDASHACHDCGNKYGKFPKGHMATFYEGSCGVCGEKKVVTEARDYGYFKKTLKK